LWLVLIFVHLVVSKLLSLLSFLLQGADFQSEIGAQAPELEMQVEVRAEKASLRAQREIRWEGRREAVTKKLESA